VLERGGDVYPLLGVEGKKLAKQVNGCSISTDRSEARAI
jgi:hypothetical protein